MADNPQQRRFARRRNRPARARPEPPAEPAAPAEPPAAERSRRPDPMERMWRDLAGAGPSRVGVDGALRARDVDRPTPADLRAAEQEVRLVRRHWTPPEPPEPTGG